MASRGDDLNELAQDISTAIAKARQLNLPTSAYILSMVLVERVSEALKAAKRKRNKRKTTRPDSDFRLVSIHPDHPAFFDREREPAVLQR